MNVPPVTASDSTKTRRAQPLPVDRPPTTFIQMQTSNFSPGTQVMRGTALASGNEWDSSTEATFFSDLPTRAVGQPAGTLASVEST